MTSVTQRIRNIKQPRGGYLKPKEFQKVQFDDRISLHEKENISSSLVGLAVDYLSRFMMGAQPNQAFKISLLGSRIIGQVETAEKLLNDIKGLDDKSIDKACKLVGFDVCFRSGLACYRDVNFIEPDLDTIENIRNMVNRSITFFEKYGPVVSEGFTFEGGYTDIINAGDGDFLTSDTLWDFKVSASNPNSQHTLQLLVYYIMGVHSIHNEFKTIDKLGIFNPRKNCIFVFNISDIPTSLIEEVSTHVIGYTKKFSQSNTQSATINHTTSPKLITATEAAKILGCSRYKIMKYYEEYSLPLTKINNRYYINIDSLEEWVYEKQEEEKKARQQNTIVTITFIAITILVIFLILIMAS